MTEGTLLKKVMVRATKLGYRMFRNNVAKAWVGKYREIKSAGVYPCNQGDVIVYGARRLHAGLCKGSSDLIGWKSVTITPDMVGQKVAIFTAFECKTGKLKTTREQSFFINAVKGFGGIAAVVREEGDVDGAK